MRIKEIYESILDKKGRLDSDQAKTLSNTSTLPNQNMYHGSGYLHSMYLKSLASAGAGTTEDGPMPEKNWAGGDPIASPYHPVEEEMIDRAMKAVGDTGRVKWGNRRSEEPAHVNRASPVKNPGPITRRR